MGASRPCFEKEQEAQKMNSAIGLVQMPNAKLAAQVAAALDGRVVKGKGKGGKGELV